MEYLLKHKGLRPAGFKVVNPEDNVEDGIVIEDVAHGATSGSQFVWIPVGIINRKDKEDITITLSRYTFASETGEETDQGANLLNYHLLEVSNSSYGNTTAKEDIETEKTGFRRSAIENGGYYIGRYEARTISQRTSETNDSGLTQVTVKPNDYVYRYITQPQAAELSQNMYEDNNFESDLMNSYAWDTAITFLQKCDNREKITIPYSMQSTLNVEFASQGTNNLKTMDEICSIFDMASNCYEWITETSDYPDSPCVIRAGGYDKTERNTAYRQRIS